jgi:hypothetical protein
LLSVIYVSVADPGLTPGDIAAMVGVAQVNNARDALTGALIYNGQNFMQLLEGPVARVEACLARIRADLRHNGMIELRRRLVEGRDFSEFSMLYSPLFREHAEDLSRLAARGVLDMQDAQLMTNFLALGRFGGVG